MIMKKKTYIRPQTIVLKQDFPLMLVIGSGKTKPEDTDAKGFTFDSEGNVDRSNNGEVPNFNPWEE